MHIELHNRQGHCTLHVAGELTIYTALDAKEQLLRVLDVCQELEIDLSEVSELDTAGFQILVLLKREAQRADKKLYLSAHSPVVIEVLDTLQMAAFFGDPLVVPNGNPI